jgi:putative hydrolase of the HAD superfamily
LACLSNSNEVHWHESLTTPFDHAFSSHLIGAIKPDPEAFEYVLEALDVAPSAVLFFDDALSNVESARRLGIESYQTLGFDALRTRLESLDLL